MRTLQFAPPFVLCLISTLASPFDTSIFSQQAVFNLQSSLAQKVESSIPGDPLELAVRLSDRWTAFGPLPAGMRELPFGANPLQSFGK